MTWFASGITFASSGTSLDDEGAIDAALLSATDGADFLDGFQFTGRDLNGAVLRASGRWRGDDDTVTPLLRLDSRQPLRVQIGQDFAEADRAFGAFVAPPGAQELSLLFVNDGLNEAVSAVSGSAQPSYPLRDFDGIETYVLVDAFIGASTTRQTFLAKVIDGTASFTLRLGGHLAVILGTRIRVFAQQRTTRDTDPTWLDRLNAIEQRPEHLLLAAKHPRLQAAPSHPSPIAVLVHGTFSSCVQALVDVSPLAGSVPLYRFEHDTLRPVADNVDELVACLKASGSEHITLIGHSRGGLVATMAAADLAAIKQVLTLGTPHKGTPLAAAGDNLFGYAVATIGTQVQSVLDGGLRAAHIQSMLPAGHLPDGWTDMLPHSSFIRLLGRLPRTVVEAFGGTFDGDKNGFGLLPGIAAETMSALMADENDLVVPLESSCPVELLGTSLEQVHHFGYFKNPAVRIAIKEALQKSTKQAQTSLMDH